jgi:outer membrane immunogenic protein
MKGLFMMKLNQQYRTLSTLTKVASLGGLFISSLLMTNQASAQATLPSREVAAQTRPQVQDKRVDVSKDLDSLGGDAAMIKMAQSLDSGNRARIVQGRSVDRYSRFEIGLNYGGVGGGDAYLSTKNIGLALDFHFTPRWSAGVRYFDYSNNLTSEGDRIFQQARQAYNQQGRSYLISDIDYPLNAMMAVINWYPIYGKTSLFETKVAQFDMYLLAGGGQISLSSGKTTIYTGGAGVGFWISNHFTARAEVRYQNYNDQVITGPRKIDTVVGTLGLGFLL